MLDPNKPIKFFGTYSFDEGVVKHKVNFCATTGRLFLNTKCQIGEVKGLDGDYRQVLFCDFNTDMDEELLKETIDKLEEAGVTILAIVCDNGPTNQKLWSKLGVDVELGVPFFEYKGKKIFCFSDHSHCIKLLREHFILKFLRMSAVKSVNESTKGKPEVKITGIDVYPRKFLDELVLDPNVNLTLEHLNPKDLQDVGTALKVMNQESKF